MISRKTAVSKPTAFLIAAALAASLVSVPTGAAEKLTVFTVNYPLKYFAQRIAGDRAEVIFPAPPDVDPAYWMPDPGTVSDYQKGDLILLNGAGYARWVRKVSLPTFRLVDTSASFSDRYIESAGITTHSHGPEGKHAHESLAFTTWLDMPQAAEQARAILQALEKKLPSQKENLRKNYAALENDLAKIDLAIREIVSKDPDKPLVVSHPVYDYLARGYGLNIRSVHWEPDEVPTPAQISELKTLLKEHPAEWMVWEGEPVAESVRLLKEMGLESLVFDPSGNVPGEGDFLGVMEKNLTELKKAFEE